MEKIKYKESPATFTKTMDINKSYHVLPPGTKLREIFYDKGQATLPSGEILKLKGKLAFIFETLDDSKYNLNLEELNQFQNNCNEVGIQSGAFDRNTKYFKKFQKVEVPVLCALTCPRKKLESLEPYGLLMTIFFILDDIVDNSKDISVNRIPEDTVFQAINAFVNTILRDDNSEENEVQAFPLYKSLSNLLQMLRNFILEINCSNRSKRFFFDSFVEYLEAVAWESTNAWKSPTSITSSITEEYFNQRELTIGLLPCLEILCILQGIEIPPRVRRDPIFLTIRKLVAHHVVMVNDIFSLKKEIENGERDNFLLIKNHSGFSGENCLREAELIIESCVRRLLWYENKLLKKFGTSNKNLSRYILLCKTWMDGHIHWSLRSKRFGETEYHVA